MVAKEANDAGLAPGSGQVMALQVRDSKVNRAAPLEPHHQGLGSPLPGGEDDPIFLRT